MNQFATCLSKANMIHLYFWFADTIVRYFFQFSRWNTLLALRNPGIFDGENWVQDGWMGTGNWGIFHWNDAWKGPDPFGDFPSLDMDHNICPLFKGIFKSLFIELLGGLLGVCRQKSRYQWTQVKQRGFQDFLAWWLSFSIDILSIMIPRFWNRHGCHTTNSFVGPKAIKHQQTFFDVLGEPLGYPVGTFGKHSQKPFDRYLRCFFWVTAHTLALYSFIYKILFSFLLFLFI